MRRKKKQFVVENEGVEVEEADEQRHSTPINHFFLI